MLDLFVRAVLRYPVGEIELSPEYCTEPLPRVVEPFGNIRFAGADTHPASFVDGAVLSAFAAARKLGSDLVGPDDEKLMRCVAMLER